MMKHCGLVDSKNSCRCHKKAGRDLQRGLVPAGRRSFLKKEGVAKSRAEAETHLKELSEIDRTAAMFRRCPEYRSPESFLYIVKDLIDSGKYLIFME